MLARLTDRKAELIFWLCFVLNFVMNNVVFLFKLRSVLDEVESMTLKREK